MIGSDSAAGRLIGQLAGIGGLGQGFPASPRRVIPQMRRPSTRAKRWLRRNALAEPVNSPPLTR